MKINSKRFGAAIGIGCAQQCLHPTRLSRLDFDIDHIVVSGSDQSGTLQSRLAGEANRPAGRFAPARTAPTKRQSLK
jgi:hypothetical protein